MRRYSVCWLFGVEKVNATTPVRRRAINRLRAQEPIKSTSSIEPVEEKKPISHLPEIPKFKVSVPFKELIEKVRNKR